ncbi:MAG: STAS domain-containing protein [Candidatus Korobacteraceae bacterium]|jgi:anti-sigma B factor antagonist
MSTAPRASFGWKIEKSTDELNNAVTTVKCHGRVVSDTAAQLREVVKPLIPLGGRILIDLTDVEHVDSSGLGTLVGLKASAVNAGYCTLELVNLTPRVAELLRITKLTQLFSS